MFQSIGNDTHLFYIYQTILSKSRNLFMYLFNRDASFTKYVDKEKDHFRL